MDNRETKRILTLEEISANHRVFSIQGYSYSGQKR